MIVSDGDAHSKLEMPALRLELLQVRSRHAVCQCSGSFTLGCFGIRLHQRRYVRVTAQAGTNAMNVIAADFRLEIW